MFCLLSNPLSAKHTGIGKTCIRLPFCQICNLLSAMNDEDLRQDCRITLTNLSSSLLTPEILPTALVTIKEVAIG